MIYGYGRVSTKEQKIDLQTEALKKAGCEKIYLEKISGTIKERPELDKCLASLELGDTLIVWRMDRLGRSIKNLIELVELFNEKGVNLICINENINTDNNQGKFFFYLCACFAEMELSLIKERTRAGLAAARARGRFGGRKPKLSEEQQKLLWTLYMDNKPMHELKVIFGVTTPTIYRYIRNLKKENLKNEKI